jgi:hypothetical protein
MRAISQLRDAYAAGHVSTSTLEARIALALTGDADGAVWDRPRGWHRRPAAQTLVIDGVERPLGTSTCVGRARLAVERPCLVQEMPHGAGERAGARVVRGVGDQREE